MLFLRNARGRRFTTINQPHLLGVIILSTNALSLITVSAAEAHSISSTSEVENYRDEIVKDNPVLPNAGDVVSAYTKLRRWTDNFSLPSADDPDSRITLQDARGRESVTPT